jgi:hypothetical protein
MPSIRLAAIFLKDFLRLLTSGLTNVLRSIFAHNDRRLFISHCFQLTCTLTCSRHASRRRGAGISNTQFNKAHSSAGGTQPEEAHGQERHTAREAHSQKGTRPERHTARRGTQLERHTARRGTQPEETHSQGGTQPEDSLFY